MNNLTIEIQGADNKKVLDLYINQEGRFMEATFIENLADGSIEKAIELISIKSNEYKIPSLILNFKGTTSFENLPSATWLVDKINFFKDTGIARIAVVFSEPVLSQIKQEQVNELSENIGLRIRLFKTSTRGQGWVKSEASGIIIN
jgi:hypothetical protein